MSQPRLLWRRANNATLDTLRGNSPGQYDIRLGRKQQVREFFEGLPQMKDHEGLRTDIWTEPVPLPGSDKESPPWKLEIRRMSEESKRRDLYIRAQRPETAHPLWRPGTGPTDETGPESDYVVLLRTAGDRFYAGWLRGEQLADLPEDLRTQMNRSGVDVAALDNDAMRTTLAVLNQGQTEEEATTQAEDVPPEEVGQAPPALDPAEVEGASAQEGQTKIVQHVRRERSRSLRRKRLALAGGQPACEVCGFDFEQAYGERGRGFIECHHKIPLPEIDPATPTQLEDLALLCANCHRMVHASRPWITVEALKELLANPVSK